MGSGGDSGGGLSVDPFTLVYELYNFFANPGAIFDPASYFDGAFVGLPTYVKSAQTGSRLSHSHSPLVIALGLHFYNLAVNGHYLSSTPDLNQYFGPAMKYTTSALYGYQPAPVDAYMQAVVFSGAPIAAFDSHYFSSNPPQPQLLTEAQFLQINPGHIFPTGFYNHLQKVWSKLYPVFGQPPPPPSPPPPSPPPPSPPPPSPPPPSPPPPSPPPPSPPPPSPPPPAPPPPSPPPPSPPPPAPPPPSPVPPPIVSPPQPSPCPSVMQGECQDELAAIGQQLSDGLQAINSALQFGDSVIANNCCAAIVDALASLQTAVQVAIASIPQQPPPTLTVDLSPVAAAIANLGTVAAAANAAEAGCCAKIDADLQAIANAMPGSVDLKPIVDAIDRNSAMFDIPHSLVQQLMSDGTIPGQYSSLLQGTAAEWVDKVLKILHLLNPAKKVEEYAVAEAKELTADVRALFEKIKTEIGALASALAATDKKFYDGLVAAIGIVADYLMHSSDKTFTPIVKELVNDLVGFLTPSPVYPIKLGDIGVEPDAPLGVATGIAVDSMLLGWVVSYFSKDAGETLAKIGELFGGAIGFEELKDVLVGPLIRHGIAAVADMKARALFAQHLPKAGDVAQWDARGIATSARSRELMRFDGCNDEIAANIVTAAQRSIVGFQLLRLFRTGLFHEADIRDEMTFGGMRKASQDRMVLAAPYIATDAERKQLESALESAYVAGLLSDADLTTQLDGLDHNTDRDSLALSAAKWKKLVKHTTDLETEYSTLFRGGLIDDGTYRSFLSGIGLQPDTVDVVAAKAEAQANATLHRKELSAAAALARATATEERRAALAGYAAGKLNAAGLAAALIATGLTATQAAAWVVQAQNQSAGRQRYVFGMQSTPTGATLLQERVAALTEQRKKTIITAEQLTQALTNLGLGDKYINAIRARTEALVKQSAGSLPTAVPVQTAS